MLNVILTNSFSQTLHLAVDIPTQYGVPGLNLEGLGRSLGSLIMDRDMQGP